MIHFRKHLKTKHGLSIEDYGAKYEGQQQQDGSRHENKDDSCIAAGVENNAKLLPSSQIVEQTPKVALPPQIILPPPGSVKIPSFLVERTEN